MGKYNTQVQMEQHDNDYVIKVKNFNQQFPQLLKLLYLI